MGKTIYGPHWLVGMTYLLVRNKVLNEPSFVKRGTSGAGGGVYGAVAKRLRQVLRNLKGIQTTTDCAASQ